MFRQVNRLAFNGRAFSSSLVTIPQMDATVSVRQPDAVTVQEKVMLLRSLFYVKKSKISEPLCWYNKVQADAFILDLEDAVPAKDKQKVRQEISRVLPQLPGPLPHLLVRINALDDGDNWVKDILNVHHHRLLGFVLSKVERGSDVEVVSRFLNTIEHKMGIQPNHFKLIPLVETALGVLRAEEIAHASNRNVAMLLGRYDLMASTGSSLDSSLMEQACNQVALAARSAKLLPLLSSYCELDNFSYFRKESEEARNRGFMGRSTLTPQQVIIANETFGIGSREVSQAEGVLKAAAGLSTHQSDSTRHMVGPPHQKKALCLLARRDIQNIYDDNKRQRISTGPGPLEPRMMPTTPTSMAPQMMKLGSFLTSPFEVTLSEGTAAVWEQHFFPSSRLNTSVEYAKQLGLKGILVPYSLLMNLAMSMSVAVFSQNAKVHLEIARATQLEPVYLGETVQNVVRPLKVDQKSNCLIVVSEHLLKRASDGRPVFRVLKKTMFPNGSIQFDRAQAEESNLSENVESLETSLETYLSKLLIDRRTDTVPGQPLKKGELFIHELVKSFGANDAVGLSYFLKGTNPLHINTIRFKANDLLVSGPCVAAATLANRGSDFGEVFFEEIFNFKSINKTHNNDMISTVNLVADVRQSRLNSNLEEVSLVAMGVRNIDPSDLRKMSLPVSLFSLDMSPKQFEQVCADHCPELYHNVVTVGRHRLIRLKQH